MRGTKKGSTPGLLDSISSPRVNTSTDAVSVLRCPSPVRSYVVENNKAVSDSDALELQLRMAQDSSPSVHTSSVKEDVYYPEGGLQAWSVTFGSFCAMFAAFGLLNTVGTLQAYLAENQLKKYNQATISWIFSIYLFLVFFCGLQIGPVFDSKGPRMLLVAGAVLQIISLLLLGLCKGLRGCSKVVSLADPYIEYWHFILDFSIVGGVGCSLLFTPAIGAVAHWFNVRRGFATGVAATVSQNIIEHYLALDNNVCRQVRLEALCSL